MSEREPHGELDPRRELSYLARAFAQQLEVAQRRGQRWVGGGPAPRQRPLERVDDAVDAAAAVPVVRVDAAPNEPEAPVWQEQPGIAPVMSAALPSGLDGLRAELGDCQRCRLAAGRRNLVFGVGNPQADLLFVGEAPGRDEDLQGEPFVGAAGQLLTKMIRAMGLERDEVYICNILKCRPPENRDPRPDEVAACEPFLRRQIDTIAPRFIIAMGNFAAKTLLRTDTGITRLRGTFATYQGVPLMPTFHPAYLLRNAEAKRPAWSDLQAVMARMDELGLTRRRR